MAPGETLKRVCIISIVLGLLVGATVVYLNYFYINNEYFAILIFIAFVFIVGLPLDHFAYKNGKFVKKQKQRS